MALDRTWYNALIDDDGSGMTGSVWDKADIKNLLDSIDAELLRFDSALSSGTFAPTLSSAGGGTPIYGSQSGLWERAGKLIHVSGSLSISSKGSLAGGAASISGLPIITYGAVQQGALFVGYFGGLALNVASLGGYANPGETRINLTYIPAAGSSGSAIMDTAHLSNGFNVLFGAVYRTT